MSISLRFAIPPPAAPVLRRQKVRAAGNGDSPVARVALRKGALRGCASLPLRPQPLSMGVGVDQPCRRRGAAAVCYASALLNARTMQWVSAGATAKLTGELELPLSTMLLVTVAPYQLMNMRGTQGGAILSLALAGYLAFQHFTRVGSLGKAVDQGSIIATLAIICITIIPLILLF